MRDVFNADNDIIRGNNGATLEEAGAEAIASFAEMKKMRRIVCANMRQHPGGPLPPWWGAVNTADGRADGLHQARQNWPGGGGARSVRPLGP